MTRHLTRPVFLVLCALVAGCSAHASASGGADLTPTPPSAAASVPVSSPRPVPSATAQLPVLGQSRGITEGYGSVRPATLNNGGDPTGIVGNLSWQSWGGPEAVGTGIGYYDPPNVPVAQATKEQATVVAFDLGTCAGQYVYQAVEWYFPESGGSFNPASYLNVCSWTYQPGG
ncbi:MAG: hypothetical protein ACRDOK_20450 [Streptosporangiaceae bacterium]